MQGGNLKLSDGLDVILYAMCDMHVTNSTQTQIRDSTSRYHDVLNATYYRPQQSWEVYVFTSVCLSTGGEYLTRYTPRTRYNPPGPGTPPDQVHPPDQVQPPGTRYTPQTRHTA